MFDNTKVVRTGIKREANWSSEELLREEPPKPFEVEEVKKIYPKSVSMPVIQKITDVLNAGFMGEQDFIAEFIREQMIDCMGVLGENKAFNVTQYVNAVRFVSYKHLGESTVGAFAKTFPDKIKKLEAQGVPKEHIYAYASRFARSKLVVNIEAIQKIPIHIMFKGTQYEAINTLVGIMRGEPDNNNKIPSHKVRMEASLGLIRELKDPAEVGNKGITVSIPEGSTLSNYLDTVNKLASTMVEQLQEGKMTLNEVITTGDYVEVEGDEDE